ncbi:hypothetical protein BN946_scf184803.g34 [Trametes cinnabarina]|uniref:F-box domain-containing protein n=1 Tax=Pycnoporus cinnabarinus TaxID=5643 RepID=A0A060S6M9_PYCCI|nr:hypothetical protein BN946_scf184803.g34 [Trametes cinnabarina]
MIFEDVVRSEQCDKRLGLQLTGDGRVPIRSLLSITHVCSKWRTAVLQRPTFWTRADDHNHEQLQAFTERSRGLPLSLCVSKTAATGLDTVDGLWPRLRRLDLRLSDQNCDAIDLLGILAPQLECLTVVLEGIDRLPDEAWQRFARYHFDAPCSQLKALALSPAAFMRPPYHFPNLTHLYLSFNFTGRRVELKALLSTLPMLEHLHLHALSKENSTVVPFDGVPVKLSRLRTLTCTQSHAQRAFDLLELIEFPVETMVRLQQLTCHRPANVSLPDIIASQEFWNSFSRLEVASEYFDMHAVAEGPRSGLWIQGTYTSNSTPFGWLRWFTEDFFLSLDMEKIEEIHTSAFYEDFAEEFVHSARHLKTLRVVVSDQEDEDWMSSYRFFHIVADFARAPWLELEELESIYIDTWACDGLATLDPGLFIELLENRSRAGFPIRRLHINLDTVRFDQEARNWFKKLLEPAREFVEDFQIFEGRPLCKMEMSHRWQVDEAEAYWGLPSDQRPRYILPFTE